MDKHETAGLGPQGGQEPRKLCLQKKHLKLGPSMMLQSPDDIRKNKSEAYLSFLHQSASQAHGVQDHQWEMSGWRRTRATQDQDAEQIHFIVLQ